MRDDAEYTEGSDGWHEQQASKIRLIPFADLVVLDDPQYLVDSILPRAGLVIVWGAPKSGKSFWLFDLLLHVALGWEYRGHEVEQGTVVYCYFEGQRAAAARKEAFAQRHLREHGAAVPFYLMPVTLNLVADHVALIEAIKALNLSPVAVALDTLNRSLHGSESKDADMALYIRACDAIRDAFDCCVPLVHHSGHDTSRYRGHSSLGGAHDAMISVSRAGQDAPVIVEVQEMKDGLAGAKLASRLDVVEVGATRAGKPITSCVVVPCEPPGPAERAAKLTRNQETMLAILHEAKRPLATEEWNEAARTAGLGTRKADLYDFRHALKKKGLIYEGVNGWNPKR